MPAEQKAGSDLLQEEFQDTAHSSDSVKSLADAGTLPPAFNTSSTPPSESLSFQQRMQKLIKHVLPASLWSGLRVAAELKPVCASRYRRARAVASAWRRAGRKPVLPPRIKSLVFVCHGNIMRSPVSEAILKKQLEERGIANVNVASAGMHALNGRSADPRSLKVAPEFGVTVSQHRAQLLTQALIDAYDLVIVMDIQNAAEFLIRYPDAGGKLFMLRQFSEQSRGAGRDIPDPYPGDEDYMRQCCRMLNECIAGLTDELAAANGKVSAGGHGR